MSLMPDRAGRLPRQERRAQLLEAAREAFVQQGYHAAGMDAIAELAGVSKPVLYQHFPGKLELYLAVLDESSDSLIDRVRKALESTHENRKRVRATFEAYFDFVAHESGSFRLVFESDLTNVPAVVSRVARTNETCAKMIAEVIREDTELDDDTSMLLASGLLGMAQTSARRWLHDPTPMSQSEAARAMAALAWRGISGFPLTSSAGDTTGAIVAPSAGSGESVVGATPPAEPAQGPTPEPAAPTTPEPAASASRASTSRAAARAAKSRAGTTAAGSSRSSQAKAGAAPAPAPASPRTPAKKTTRTPAT